MTVLGSVCSPWGSGSSPRVGWFGGSIPWMKSVWGGGAQLYSQPLRKKSVTETFVSSAKKKPCRCFRHPILILVVLWCCGLQTVDSAVGTSPQFPCLLCPLSLGALRAINQCRRPWVGQIRTHSLSHTLQLYSHDTRPPSDALSLFSPFLFSTRSLMSAMERFSSDKQHLADIRVLTQ